MEHSHCWEDDSCSARQFCTFYGNKVHYLSRNVTKPVPILGQMKPIHTLPSYFLANNLILSSHLRLRLSSGLFPWGFPTKILCAFLIPFMPAKWSANLIFLYSIILISQKITNYRAQHYEVFSSFGQNTPLTMSFHKSLTAYLFVTFGPFQPYANNLRWRQIIKIQKIILKANIISYSDYGSDHWGLMYK
jgi:hypothetical protein